MSQCTSLFADYKTGRGPGYFAVSTDGNSAGYSYCETGGVCGGPSYAIAMNGCKAHARGVPCVIYAVYGQEVFSADASPVTAAAPRIAPSPPAAPPMVTTMTTVTPAPASAPLPTIAETWLEALIRLRDKKLITEAEYQERRKAILGSL